MIGMAEETEGDNLHLRVSVGDITIEAAGPIDEAESWFEALREDYLSDVDPETIEGQINGVSDSNSSNPSTEPQDTSDSKKSRTLPEYYQMTNGITKKDTALLTGWFIETKNGEDDFTKGEIEEEAQSAKLNLGKNVSRDLSYKVEDGHLAEVGERNGNPSFHVTITGEEYVENELLEGEE